MSFFHETFQVAVTTQSKKKKLRKNKTNRDISDITYVTSVAIVIIIIVVCYYEYIRKAVLTRYIILNSFFVKFEVLLQKRIV